MTANTLTPIAVDCPVCHEPIALPGRIVIDPGKPESQIMLDLGEARRHSREHGETPDDPAAPFDSAKCTVLPAVLARLGVAW